MKTRFEDKFAGKLDQAWNWVNEQPGAWKVADGALHLRTLPGTLWGETNNAHNFLLHPLGERTEGVATRVTVRNHPQLIGEQAGLIWYYDDDNYIKLVKESLEGEQWIVLAREEGGQPALVDRTRLSAETAQLQLVLLGAELHGQFRCSPEDDWQEVGLCALVGDAEPRVGVFTHGGPDEIERWAELRDFSILEP